jgi:uncharacterized protein (DUF433 family)
MNSRIVVTSTVLFSKPRIKGTRIPVEQVLACLAEGWSHKKIIKEFSVTEEDIQACIDFAHRSVVRTHFVTSTGKAHA